MGDCHGASRLAMTSSKLIMPNPQCVIERAIGLHFQFIYDADKGEIDRDKFLITHGQRGFT